MSLNARRTKRVQKPALEQDNLSGQVTFSDGYVPDERKPRSSRFEAEFERAMAQRGFAPLRNLGMIPLNPEDLIPFEVPKRADRRVRSAEHRVARATLKAAIAARKAGLAHGDATEVYEDSATKAVVKLTYRELQLAGKTAQARQLAKQHGLR